MKNLVFSITMILTATISTVLFPVDNTIHEQLVDAVNAGELSTIKTLLKSLSKTPTTEFNLNLNPLAFSPDLTIMQRINLLLTRQFEEIDAQTGNTRQHTLYTLAQQESHSHITDYLHKIMLNVLKLPV